MKHIGIFFSGLLLIVSLWSCKDIAGGNDDQTEIVFPDTGVKYGAHVQPLFDRKCAFSGCHDANRFLEMGFSLDNYDHLMYGTKPVVFRGEPDNSPLLWRIEGRSGTGPRMPPDRTPLNENQIRGIRTWIRERARNN